MNDRLSRIYYDTKHPAGFGSAVSLAKATSYPLKTVKEWLRSQDAYTLHAPVRKKFLRNYYKVSSIDDTWQADLCDMRFLAKENEGIHYILTVIDILSKYAWAVPLKDKSAGSVKSALTSILQESGRVPKHLMTDKGKEFVNVTLKKLYHERGIHFYTSQNPDVKASVVERFNRTLKTKMWKYFTHKQTRRYVDVLDDLMHAYNHTVHSAIKMAPADVCAENERLVFSTLYAKRMLKKQKPNLAAGDHVRISKEKGLFAKGFERNWSREIFKIRRIQPRDRVVYELTDLADEPIEGTFYQIELQKVNLPESFKIDKIIRVKGKGASRQLYVKWVGYPDKFNTWIAAKDLVP